MEGDNRWHYTRLTPETYAAGLAELSESGRGEVTHA
jgi:hypothetical protein